MTKQAIMARLCHEDDRLVRLRVGAQTASGVHVHPGRAEKAEMMTPIEFVREADGWKILLRLSDEDMERIQEGLRTLNRAGKARGRDGGKQAPPNGADRPGPDF